MPMDRSRYPADWEAIALAVKDAAGWTCQACGRICRRGRSESWEAFFERLGHRPEKPVRHVLTVAHLAPDPADCRPENLRAWCSVCHCRHDAAQRRELGIRRLYGVAGGHHALQPDGAISDRSL